MIDSQGRCVITDHGAFVLFNCYGPAVTNITNDRFAFKMQFYEVCAQSFGFHLHPLSHSTSIYIPGRFGSEVVGCKSFLPQSHVHGIALNPTKKEPVSILSAFSGAPAQD